MKSKEHVTEDGLFPVQVGQMFSEIFNGLSKCDFKTNVTFFFPVQKFSWIMTSECYLSNDKFRLHEISAEVASLEEAKPEV